MRVSLNWLRQYVDFDLTPFDLAHQLTMCGLEVESIEEIGKDLKGFLIGEVLSVEKHPNANKLTVCLVNDGKEVHQIVCGAPNVKNGQKIVFGLAGTIVPRNQHSPTGEPFKLEKVKIRGVESKGMICSEFELGIGDDKDGILVLDANAPVGDKFIEYLGIADTVYEIGITPNRADALSHIGIARDISAILNIPLKTPKFVLVEGTEKVSDHAWVEIIDVKDCPRYCAKVIKNINISPSPEWLQKALKAVGLRPINNVVDITNFVLMETGHPLHAFDYDLLHDHKIIVKRAHDGDKFLTLDGKEHKIFDDTLLICDGSKAVALAGVMGGQNSEINDKTTNILLECAYFNPRSIRRTSKKLGISTDASYRFERGADPNILTYVIDRASFLIKEIAGGDVLNGIIDIYTERIENLIVEIRISRANSILGSNIEKNEINEILTRLGMIVNEKDSDTFSVEVPSYRPDIEREIDLIEEVARIYGYDNIKDSLGSNIKFTTLPLRRDIKEDVKNYLVGLGYNEIITNSLLESKDASIFNDSLAQVINPISQSMTTLRPCLIPGALLTVKKNLNIGEKNLRLFEIGNIFSVLNTEDGQSKFIESTSLLMLMTGKSLYPTWNSKNIDVDFYDIKGEVENLFAKIFLESYKLISYSNAGYELSIEIGGKKAGVIKQIERSVLDYFDIGQEVYLSEISFDVLKENTLKAKKFNPPSKYPTVKRDIAFIIEEHAKVEDIQREIKLAASRFLNRIELFDIFAGGKIEKNMKNIAFSLEFISKDNSFTSEAIDIEMKQIAKRLEEKFNAVLREF